MSDAGASGGSRRPRRPTIKDVAAAANLSKSTVSLALQGSPRLSRETIERVRQAAKAVGYIRNQAASQLASRGREVIGLYVRDTQVPYYGWLHRCVQEACDDEQTELLATTMAGPGTAERERRALYELVGSGIHVLLVGSGTVPQAELQELARRVPVIALSRPRAIPSVVSIGHDEVTNARLLVDHIASRGHRRIGVMGLAEEWSDALKLRTSTCVERVRELGLEAVEIPLASKDLAREHETVWRYLRSPDAPTAVICRHDEMSVNLIRWTRDRGIRVPDDISVAGFDGWLPGLDLIGLTTVRLDVARVARRAVKAATEIMAGQRDHRSPELFPGQLLDHGSIRQV